MKIITIVGARPQFVKAAVVSRAIEEHNKIATSEHIEEKIIHTNQHYDDNMSDIFFEEMCIPKPHYNLHLGGGTQGAMTGRMLEKIEHTDPFCGYPDVICALKAKEDGNVKP